MDLVDTDILIDVQRGHPPALAWFAGQAELPAVPGFVVMELLQDARNAHHSIRLSFKTNRAFTTATSRFCGTSPMYVDDMFLLAVCDLWHVQRCTLIVIVFKDYVDTFKPIHLHF